jgi:hypothetical protein
MIYSSEKQYIYGKVINGKYLGKIQMTQLALDE